MQWGLANIDTLFLWLLYFNWSQFCITSLLGKEKKRVPSLVHVRVNFGGNSERDRSIFQIRDCAGFHWDRVNFLHSSQHGVIFWICAENSVDNPEIFLLLPSSVWTSSRPFLLLTLTSSKEAGGHKELWGDTGGTADPDSPTLLTRKPPSCISWFPKD